MCIVVPLRRRRSGAFIRRGTVSLPALQLTRRVDFGFSCQEVGAIGFGLSLSRGDHQVVSLINLFISV